jgi:hypothetical protein
MPFVNKNLLEHWANAKPTSETPSNDKQFNRTSSLDCDSIEPIKKLLWMVTADEFQTYLIMFHLNLTKKR